MPAEYGAPKSGYSWVPTLRTRGRQQRGRRYGKASPHLAGSETSGMRENTVCGTREALHLAW